MLICYWIMQWWNNCYGIILSVTTSVTKMAAISQTIFPNACLNGNVWTAIELSLKFIPKGPINIISSFVQIMVWHRAGDKPLSETMMVSLLARKHSSLGLNDITTCDFDEAYSTLWPINSWKRMDLYPVSWLLKPRFYSAMPPVSTVLTECSLH